MSSMRTVYALAALALVLAASLAWDLSVPDSRLGARLVPELEHLEPSALRIERDAGAVALRRGGAGWRLLEPFEAPADGMAVENALAALELLAARRELGGGALDPSLTVAIEFEDGARAEIACAAANTGKSATCARGGARYLVAEELVRELRVGAEELRGRRPLLPLAGRGNLVVEGGEETLEIGPEFVRAGGASYPVDPEAARALADSMSQLTIDRFTDEASGDMERQLVFRSDGQVARMGWGPGCGEGELAVETDLGTGCAREAAVRAVADRASLVALMSRSPFAGLGEPVRVSLRGTSGRSLRATIDSVDRAEVVRAWALGVFAAIENRTAPVPAGTPVAEASIEDAAGRVRKLQLFRDGEQYLLRRDSEALGMAADPALAELFVAHPWRFRPLIRIDAEPHQVAAIRTPEGRFVRGETLEDWRGPDGQAIDAEVPEAAARAAAPLRASSVIAPRALPEHGLDARLVFELLREDGAETVAIELGADTDTGCAARVGGGPEVVELDSARCAALRALL